MTKIKITIKLIAILLLAFISSCGEDEPVMDPTPMYQADVLVINEGNFLSGDGTISTIDLTLNEVEFSKFASTNGFPMAATIQSVTSYDNKYYFVTNNSHKIEVTDSNFKSMATIKSSDDIIFSSPFDMAATGTTGFVSDWGQYNSGTFSFENGFIGVIDLTTSQLIAKIERASQPQDLLVLNGGLYVSNVSSNTISVLNPNTYVEDETIEVSFGHDKMLTDKNGKLWVICTSGNLVQIDPETNIVLKTIDGINTQGFNEKFVINQAGDKLYYLSFDWGTSMGAVYELDITATDPPTDPIILSQNSYGLGIQNDLIYLGNSNAFQGNGVIEQYSLDGELQNTFDCGRGPNGFIFPEN